VVGTCPDLGTVEPIQHPLRLLARRWSRQLAAAQTIAVVEAGGRSVSLGDILGPEFAARPSEMFGPDRFHPSAAGYAAAATVLLPAVRAASGVPGDAVRQPPTAAEASVLPVAQAAVEAVDAAGTEVEAISISAHVPRQLSGHVSGRIPRQSAAPQRGSRGRWALLRRPRRSLPRNGVVDRSDVGASGTESPNDQLMPA